ncbi:MAG: HD family phosphohydrolase [Oscillospiraceae bacterium]|nr:HD family phosphohydrolase [Oscillospiraceae bacterium]
MLKAIGSKKDLLDSELSNGYFDTVSDIITDDLVLTMKSFVQHGQTSTFQHCVNVSYYNYKLCKFLKLNARSAARAGLLHDFFLYDWHTHRKLTGNRFHGLTHPAVALSNASAHFELDEREQDIILKHMFPLTLRLPSYKETVVIILVDKYCGFIETAFNLLQHLKIRKAAAA